MNKRVILAMVLGALSVVIVTILLIIGNSVNAPIPPTPGAPSSPPAVVLSRDSSSPTYTVLCIKKSDSKIRFTKTGPNEICPAEYSTVPVKLDPKLVKE